MEEEKRFSSSLSLADEIADVLRERIVLGEYGIGEKIKETQIAQEMGVSRTPIREAFKQLEDEGLIEYKRNRGCFARGFTRQDISDIYAVRKALEVLAVEWACQRMTPEYLKQMQEQIDLMEFYTRRNDSRHMPSLNTSFHDIIYNAAGSRFMTQVLRSYKGYIDKNRKVVFYKQSYLEAILEEHRSILAALAAGDTAAAKAAMARHLDQSQKRAEENYHLNPKE